MRWVGGGVQTGCFPSNHSLNVTLSSPVCQQVAGPQSHEYEEWDLGGQSNLSRLEVADYSFVPAGVIKRDSHCRAA